MRHVDFVENSKTYHLGPLILRFTVFHVEIWEHEENDAQLREICRPVSHWSCEECGNFATQTVKSVFYGVSR